jgi:radical SAM superfamily enzyme YgiQ (UPF0313 family)
MKVLFIYPAFERHAQSHPELKTCVPCNEYIGSPSLGIACVAASTPEGIEVDFVDDRIHPVSDHLPEADLYALSFFTPAAERAMEIADMIREQGKPVVAGGIFSTMLPEESMQHFDSVVIGEGETVWPQLCKDAAAKQLKEKYIADQPVDLSQLPPPRVELYTSAENDTFSPDDYPLQMSRGCPFRCDACVLPASMGRKLRFFSEDYVWTTLMNFAAKGKRCCLTEDTSFIPVPGTRRRFRSLLKRIAQQRKTEKVELSYVGTSMPLLLNIEEEIFDEIREAGVSRFYLVGGFDPITRGAFGPGDPKMLAEAKRCVQLCHDHGVEPYVSFLLGNEEDDQGTVDRMLDFANETKINIAEFAIATPYPGTPMWKKMVKEERLLHRNWTKYNDANVVFQPNKLTVDELQEGYLTLWREFYRSRQHLSDADVTDRTIQF